MSELPKKSSSTTASSAPSDAKRKLTGCLGGLIILIFVGLVFYYVTQVPSGRAAEIKELLTTLYQERPDQIAEDDWKKAIDLTLVLHDKSNIFYDLPTPKVVAFKQQLEDRFILERFRPESLFWVWDQYAELTEEARRFQAVHHITLVDSLGFDPMKGETSDDIKQSDESDGETDQADESDGGGESDQGSENTEGQETGDDKDERPHP